jgi:flagellar L-ring protein FlgH
MRQLVFLFSIPFFLFLFSGCTAHLGDPQMNFKPPKYVEEMPSKEDSDVSASPGSIYGQGGHPLFSDHKAMHVNDIVTVIISEQTTSSNAGTKSLSRSNTDSLGGGIFTSAGGNPAVSAAATKLSGLTNLGYSNTSSSSFTGKGSATQNASFSTTISARVIKVLKNGNYFIMGKSEIMIDNEKQLVEVSGVIRPYDIGESNTINSDQISDAKILYKTEGDLDTTTRQGWGTKLIEAIWPF